MAIQLLVLDIDNTIAGRSNQVTDRVVKAIQSVQKKGILVALATGRMYNSARRFHQRVASQLPLITYNGAWIQNPLDGVKYQHLPVPSEIALELLDFFEDSAHASEIDIHCYLDDQLYVREVTEETHYYQARAGVNPIAVGDLRQILNQPTTKMLIVSPEGDVAQQLLTVLKMRYSADSLHLTQSTPKYLEITHPDANKGTATRYLAEKLLGLTAEQVMVIGDNFNDMPMLTYAGIGIAMGNAPQPVQQVADWVTQEVEADGVAVAIERFLG